jgi:hypothetical protein
MTKPKDISNFRIFLILELVSHLNIDLASESRARIGQRTEISLDAVAVANAKLDVVFGVEPGCGIQRIAFDENTAHGIEGP